MQIDLEKAIRDNLERWRKSDPEELLDDMPELERVLALEMLERFNAKQLMKMDGVASILLNDNSFTDQAIFAARVEMEYEEAELKHDQIRDGALERAYDLEYWTDREV